MSLPLSGLWDVQCTTNNKFSARFKFIFLLALNSAIFVNDLRQSDVTVSSLQKSSFLLVILSIHFIRYICHAFNIMQNFKPHTLYQVLSDKAVVMRIVMT